MKKICERAAVTALTALWLFHGVALSAKEPEAQAPAPETVTEKQAPAAEQATESLFPQDQIEQLAAPIALYPDALLAQVLMASTYPLDIVQAARWQKDNPDLKDEALETAAAEEPWDQSVKTLLFFPDVLAYMNKNLDWTQDLGDAVLGQQDDVTDAVQLLRREAKEAGNLESSEQQRVEVAPPAEGDVEANAGDETIIIQPADPQVVYVPSYNPSTAYGQTAPPPTTYYPTAYTTPTTSYVTDSGSSSTDSLVAFGAGALAGGLLTAAIMWNNNDKYDRIYYGGGGRYGGAGYWNSPKYWGGGYRQPNNINVNRNVNRGDININKGIVGNEVKKWEHNPEHRGGVRYRGNETKQKYAGAGKDRAARDVARGRDPNRKRAQLGDKDRPQAGDRARPGMGERKRPATREARVPSQNNLKRPETRQAKAPQKKDVKRPETRNKAKAPQKRDVKLNQPKRNVKRPAAKPASKPAARPASKPAAKKSSRPARSSAFKQQKGGQARAASNRGAKSRGGGGRRGGGGGGGGRGGGRR